MKIAIILAAALGIALSASCGSKPDATVPPVQDVSAK
jgi:hypothetical protein